MAGNPILAEVSDKFGARMIRMPVGFYSLGQTSDLMQTWKAWYSLSMQAARLAWDAQAVVALRCMRMAAVPAAACASVRAAIFSVNMRWVSD
jgi:hypothetical protein